MTDLTTIAHPITASSRHGPGTADHPVTREGAVLAHRYRLLSVVGKGGTSAVWRARDEILGRDVAIKELTWTCGTNENTGRTQIVNEARAAARLKHPGAVTVHDLLTDGDGLWIVMELVEARSLQEIGRASCRERVFITV